MAVHMVTPRRCSRQRCPSSLTCLRPPGAVCQCGGLLLAGLCNDLSSCPHRAAAAEATGIPWR
eukprot:2665404-Prymnesium_polylepis.1